MPGRPPDLFPRDRPAIPGQAQGGRVRKAPLSVDSTDRTFSASRNLDGDEVIVFCGDDDRWYVQFLSPDGSRATYPIPELNRDKDGEAEQAS